MIAPRRPWGSIFLMLFAALYFGDVLVEGLLR